MCMFSVLFLCLIPRVGAANLTWVTFSTEEDEEGTDCLIRVGEDENIIIEFFYQVFGGLKPRDNKVRGKQLVSK